MNEPLSLSEVLLPEGLSSEGVVEVAMVRQGVWRLLVGSGPC